MATLLDSDGHMLAQAGRRLDDDDGRTLLLSQMRGKGWWLRYYCGRGCGKSGSISAIGRSQRLEGI